MTQHSVECTCRKETILQKAIRRKMSQFRHVARMGDDRKLKTMMFGVIEGKDKRTKEEDHTENGRTT